MKKILIVLILIVAAINTNAQTGSKSILIKGGYQTDAERFGIGVEARYNFNENFRFAPDVTFYFPNNHLTGLYVNLNAHYEFKLQDNLSLYPLTGLAILNDRLSIGGESRGNTDLGFNLGGGLSYDLSPSNYLNFDFKYTFSDFDYAGFMVGYGVRF